MHRPHLVQIPQRMVEHNQHLRTLMQLAQHAQQPRIHLRRSRIAFRSSRILLKPPHPLHAIAARQIMNPQMKDRLPKRRRPLHAHRNMPRRRHRPQQHRRLNRVMVRNRHQRIHPQPLNLLRLQVIRHLWLQRRPPVRAPIIQRHPIPSAALPIEIKYPLQPRHHHEHRVNEPQRLF